MSTLFHQKDLEFLHYDLRTKRKLFPGLLFGMPMDFGRPIRMDDHVNIMKAFILAGANFPNVDDVQFYDTFAGCFAPDPVVLKIVSFKKEFSIIPGCYAVATHTVTIRIHNLRDFTATMLDREDAFFETIRMLRRHLHSFWMLMREALTTKFEAYGLNRDQYIEALTRTYNSIVTKHSDEIIVSGFRRLKGPTAASTLLDYLQAFAYEFKELEEGHVPYTYYED